MKPVFKSRENACYVVDGKEIWESRSTAVCVIVIAMDKDDKVFVLIEKRSKTMPDGPGLWVVPCGYINYDENGWDAMRRELYEETSFFIDKYNNFLVSNNDEEPFYTHTNPSENRQNIVLWYSVVYDFGYGEIPRDIESYKNSEIDAIKWIPISDISKYKWAFDHDKRINSFIDILYKKGINLK